MSSYRIASRYAKSLIDLAIEQQKLEAVKADVDYLAAVSDLRDVELLLKSPIIKPGQKARALKAIFSEKVDALTYGFIEILLRKGREAQLPDIAAEFIRQYRDIREISIVTLTSAEPMTESALEAIRQKLLASRLTHANITFETRVDPDLIGGFIISFDDKLYDASIRHQLDILRKQFTRNEFQSAL